MHSVSPVLQSIYAKYTSTAIVLSSGQVKSQMNMAAGPRNGPDPLSLTS